MSDVKKFSFEELQKIEKGSSRKKIIQFEIENQTFRVTVATKIGVQEKEKGLNGLQNISQLSIAQGIELDEAILFTYFLLNAVTDLEYPEEVNDILRFLIGLHDYGIIEKVIKTIPEAEMTKLSSFLQEVADNLPEVMKELPELDETSELDEV